MNKSSIFKVVMAILALALTAACHKVEKPEPASLESSTANEPEADERRKGHARSEGLTPPVTPGTALPIIRRDAGEDGTGITAEENAPAGSEDDPEEELLVLPERSPG